MSTSKKRLQIGCGKSLRKSKYRRMSSSGITASSDSSSSLQLSTSLSVNELALDSIKGSPTPSITSDSLVSDDIGSVSNKSCVDSSQTFQHSPSRVSLNSSDDDKIKNLSQYSNSPSNESLNSNKRITRNTSRLLEASNLTLNQSSSTSSITSHQEDIEPNRKRCFWHRCRFSIDAEKSNDQLIEHVKNKHILSQKNNKKFHCLWKNCKFYEKSSTSFMWLERHVIDHIDSRPYYCVFSGCNRKFRTQAELSRHCDLHFNTSNTTNNSNSLTAQLNTINGSMRTSPVKNRQQKHIILNTAKKALIHNIKHKNKSCSELSELNGNLASCDTNGTDCSNDKFINEKSKSSSNLLNQKNGFNGKTNSSRFQNYSQILKALTKKRKTNDFNKKKFKKAQFKDFFDVCSLKVIDNKLKQLNFKSGTCTFNANIIGSNVNLSTGVESFHVEWHPKNILENEWVEKDNLKLTKTVDINEMFKTCKINNDESNPFYSKHRFRKNKRK